MAEQSATVSTMKDPQVGDKIVVYFSEPKEWHGGTVLDVKGKGSMAHDHERSESRYARPHIMAVHISHRSIAFWAHACTAGASEARQRSSVCKTGS